MPANVTLLYRRKTTETGSPLGGGDGGRQKARGEKDKFEITGSDELPLCGKET